MEIPYVIEPRKDTGLNNSKIGIWLFLASEVMLFGGLFSGYIFLRIYADYPWPERTLPVLPGLINTFILIGSSVTVVFAWVALKLGNWKKFQMYMSITLICAVIFMALKGLEYRAKFTHQAIRLDDYTVVEGHAHSQDHDDKYGPKKNLNIQADSIQIDVSSVDDIYYETLGEQYTAGKFALANEIVLSDGTTFAKGTAISKDLIDKTKKDLKVAKAVNSELNIEANKLAWADVKAALPGKKYYESDVKELLAEKIAEYKGLRKDDYLVTNASITFESADKAKISINPRWGKLSNPIVGEEANLKLKDGTLIYGKTLDSSISIAVDGIDFRHTVMKAEEKGIDPAAAIQNSWLLKNDNIKLIWDKHQVVVAKLDEYLEPKGKEPNENDEYRINWQEIAAIKDISITDLKAMDHKEIHALFPGDVEGFTGPKHKKSYDPDSKGVAYPEIVVPREQVSFEAVFSPRWNTYYALYFTITGLHGLHVIIGAMVLGYYLFRGKKMFDTKPEWLANRVEVGGLFWHFVDLVWIFLFPVLYLM